MRNPKQPRNVADRGRDGKKSARLTPKANGPSVATKRRRTGGRVFVFHKEDLGQAGDGGQLGQEGLAGARPSACRRSGQGEADRAHLGPGTRPDEAPLQEETNQSVCVSHDVTKGRKQRWEARGGAGRPRPRGRPPPRRTARFSQTRTGTATCLSHTRHGEGETLPGYRKGPTIRGWGGALPRGHQDERPSAGDKRGHVGAVIIDAARCAAGGPRAGLTPTPRHWLWTLVTFTPWPRGAVGWGPGQEAPRSHLSPVVHLAGLGPQGTRCGLRVPGESGGAFVQRSCPARRVEPPAGVWSVPTPHTLSRGARTHEGSLPTGIGSLCDLHSGGWTGAGARGPSFRPRKGSLPQPGVLLAAERPAAPAQASPGRVWGRAAPRWDSQGHHVRGLAMKCLALAPARRG